MYCFSTATSRRPGHGGHRRAVEVRAGAVVPHHLEVAAAHAVHVAGARADVDLAVEQARRRLEDEVAAVGGRVLRVADEQPLGDHVRGAVAVPRRGLEGVELVEPATLDPREHALVVEEAAAVHVTAVARRERHGQAPHLLARAERDGAVRRQRGVGEARRPAAPRTGEHEVRVALLLRTRVLDHRRAALDDVVEARTPTRRARSRARSCAGCGRNRRPAGRASPRRAR